MLNTLLTIVMETISSVCNFYSLRVDCETFLFMLLVVMPCKLSKNADALTLRGPGKDKVTSIGHREPHIVKLH